MSTDDVDTINSTTVYVAGLNYCVKGDRTNVRLSYTAMKKGVMFEGGEIKDKTYSQVWLQFQLCLF